MTIGLPQETAAVRINRYEKAVHDADLATARRIAEALGVPLAFLYAETDTMAEAILTLGPVVQARAAQGRGRPQGSPNGVGRHRQQGLTGGGPVGRAGEGGD
ncbi:helix-turn-helix domain-containing protein [Lysobacter antibioticus]|uniref:helix-turn-helix domain-containing protein n=1 Tax=Lysobacter antibioticus TaxID=84531 RepID=UPI00126A3527|nr:helix-turn-helix transcriptional regulator [Lysobacter antibioticus]